VLGNESTDDQELNFVRVQALDRLLANPCLKANPLLRAHLSAGNSVGGIGFLKAVEKREQRSPLYFTPAPTIKKGSE
jgi:hypothetical protein